MWQTSQNRRLLEWSQLGQRPGTKATLPARKEHGYFHPAIDSQIRRRIEKLVTPRLRFGESVDARAYPTEDSPISYTNDSLIECNGTPTEASLRRQALVSKRRPLTQPEKEEIYAQDKDYRDEQTHRANLIVQPPYSTKEQSVATQIEQNENGPNNQPSSQSTEGDTYGSPKKPNLLDDFPTSLNSIKAYVTEKDGNTYIPLHSTIPLKKRRRMLYQTLEFGEITMEGLVDSGEFINAVSWSDYNAIKMNSDNCIIKEYPHPPFKIECANAQLEQPIATADIQFNIGTYTFTDTFRILSKTSFPIIGLNCMRNHQAVLDTANGTINFPHVEMTLAMTDKMKNCNPKPLQIMAEGGQTIPPHQTTTVSTIVTTTNTNDVVTGMVQPLPQFDETATIIVAPALATAHNIGINIRITNLKVFPHTKKITPSWQSYKSSNLKKQSKYDPLTPQHSNYYKTLMIHTCT